MSDTPPSDTPATTPPTTPAPRRPAIVSSAHLVSEKGAELSEFEFGLIMAGNAFNRWIVRCATAAGQPELAALDVLVLHTTNHRSREKRLVDICLVLNVEDTHTVSYSLKKLIKLDLVAASRKGKEMVYATTARGQDLCAKYREVREACLMESFSQLREAAGEVGELAAQLRTLSGLYDQASRAAMSL